MGVLTDLLVATQDELEHVPEDEVPSNVLPGADIKGIGILELEALRALLLGAAVDPGLDAFPAVGTESEDGPWLNRLPDAFVEGLAKLDDDAVKGCGRVCRIAADVVEQGDEADNAKNF